MCAFGGGIPAHTARLRAAAAAAAASSTLQCRGILSSIPLLRRRSARLPHCSTSTSASPHMPLTERRSALCKNSSVKPGRRSSKSRCDHPCCRTPAAARAGAQDSDDQHQQAQTELWEAEGEVESVAEQLHLTAERLGGPLAAAQRGTEEERGRSRRDKGSGAGQSAPGGREEAAGPQSCVLCAARSNARSAASATAQGATRRRVDAVHHRRSPWCHTTRQSYLAVVSTCSPCSMCLPSLLRTLPTRPCALPSHARAAALSCRCWRTC